MELELKITTEESGVSRVALMDGERSVSRLWVVPFTLRIGPATVRMDGIAGVGTEEEFRNRGYSRRVLEAALEHMTRGQAALSMLYGIPNFYPRFGYATAGPDHFIFLPELHQEPRLPAVWRIRPYAESDFPAVHNLYEQNTARAVGAAVRAADKKTWTRVTGTIGDTSTEQARVIEDAHGRVVAYASLAKGHWYVTQLERRYPDALTIAEVFADGPAAADAALELCRAWGWEAAQAPDSPVKQVLLPLPPEGPVAAAAMLQHARFAQEFRACGDSMARVLNVERLLRALAPAFSERLRAARWSIPAALTLQTDLGDISLTVGPEAVAVGPAKPSPGPRLEVRMPQTTLARLVLGAFPPDDLLDRLETPPAAETRELLRILFPQCHPHMYLPDRF